MRAERSDMKSKRAQLFRMVGGQVYSLKHWYVMPCLVLCGLSGLLLVACATEKKDFMASAREFESRTLFAPAIEEYKDAIEEDPNNAEAYYRIGALANELGNTEFAAQRFRQALNIDANHPGAKRAMTTYHISRGTIARQQGRLSAARSELQAAVRVDPRSSVAQLELGRVHEAEGRLDEALQAYTASAEADPHNIDTQLALGRGYLAQKQYAEAVTALKAVLDANPDRAEAYTGLGEAYFHQGQKQAAQQAFEQAIRHYLLKGRRDLAKQVKERADALFPQVSDTKQ